MGGRVTHALGYTGLGVGASRWAGGVVRDFILRPDSDMLRLELVRSAPFPFPPEPFRSLAVNLVRHELDRADRDAGRRGLVLRTLDALGIGFDSEPGGVSSGRRPPTGGGRGRDGGPMDAATLFTAIRTGDLAAVDRRCRRSRRWPARATPTASRR